MFKPASELLLCSKAVILLWICLVCDVSLCFITFLCGVSGQVWYLSVSIPDLCLLFTFENLPSVY